VSKASARKRLIMLSALIVALVASTNAQAYWISNGWGSGTGNVGTLDAPTNVQGTPGAGTVGLTWSSVTPPGSGTVTYNVKRDGAAVSGCQALVGTTCTDSGLAAGTYSYTVTAVWRTWTSTSSPATSVTLTSGAIDHFVLSAATTTPTAGAADNLTVTAKDAAGITVTSYTGSHSLTFSGAGTIGSFHPTVADSTGTATNFGTATTITFTNGVATVSSAANGVMTLYKAETASITVAEGGSYTSNALSVTVSPLGISTLSLAAASTTPAAGAADNLTITARDSYGNTATTYTGSHNLTFAGAGTIGSNNPTVTNSSGTATNFGTATALSFTNGVATVTGSSNGVMKLYKAETASITVAEGGSYTSNALSVTVSPLGISTLSLAAASTTPNAGAADNLTITAKDSYSNTATTYTGSHSLTFSGASAIGSYNPTVTNSAGTATNFGTATAITFTGGVSSAGGVMRLYRVGTASITVAEGGSYTSNAVSVTVSPSAVGSFTIPNPGTRTAGTAFTISLTAFDAYGNSATNYTGSQCLSFSGPTASPNGTAPKYPAQGSCGSGQRAVTFTNGSAASVSITLYDATAATSLTVTDVPTGNGGSTGNFAVNGLAAMGSFVLTAATTTPTAGQTDNVTISAGDTYGNAITTYTGSHNLTFSGAGPIGTRRPTMTNSSGTAINFGSTTAITFTNGSATAVMTLYRAQTANIIVSDGTYNNGSGLQITVSPAAIGGLSLAAEKAVVRPGVADNLTVRATDAYGNTAPGYTGSHNLTFAGASTSGSTHPTVTNSSGAAINFGAATVLSFTNGVAAVSGSMNGLMRLYAIERANITVSDGTYTSAVLSIVVSNVSASDVSAGGFHNCALVAGGVQCWGYNNNGQLGNGTHNNSSSPVRVLDVGGSGYLSGGSQISSGKYHTCALVSGSVYCWGQNDYGQLGDNSTTDRTTPVRVRVTTNTYLTNVAQVSSGAGQTCAVLNDGTVWCWGYNAFGQVGDNTTTTPRQMAVRVHINNNTHLTGAVEVAAGHNHSCALLSDGTVRCWGYNAYGEVGDNTTTNRSVATLVVSSSGSGTLSGVSHLSSGRFHSCALISDGSVYCWGDNDNGELGDGTTINRLHPVRAGEIATAITINAGEYHSCAALADGTAQCWGAAAFGQVGDGTTADATSPVTVIGPGGYGELTGVVKVSAGGGNWPDGSGTDNYEHTCALLSDGTVVSWGQNIYGQLGDGTTAMSISPVAVALL
jgi:alpha-tubulin suppressor-like RCC1 family protein